MFSTFLTAGLSVIALGATVYGLYQRSKGRKSGEIIDEIAKSAPQVISQAKDAINAAKAIKK